jgi:NarL family two-component system response regulator LiaR
MKKIRLILIEDNRLLREGITAMLKKEPDIVVAASLSDSDFVIEDLEQYNAQIVLIDIGLANQDSMELIQSLIKTYSSLKVIVMDLFPIEEDVLRYVESGVSGFILKDATVAEFTDTIREVATGEKILPTKLANTLFSQIMEFGIKELSRKNLVQSVRMTKREKEIITLIAEGLANKEIAVNLNLSIFTVKSHVHNILEKLALNSRVQIAIHANITD